MFSNQVGKSTFGSLVTPTFLCKSHLKKAAVTILREEGVKIWDFIFTLCLRHIKSYLLNHSSVPQSIIDRYCATDVIMTNGNHVSHLRIA